MSPRPTLPHCAPERGFVLVGVVMMVLALTIIGVSLYSLSGYESQFFGRSLFDRQALYTANGGVELAKRLLSTPLGSPPAYRLSNISRSIGREGIVSAVAWQDSPLDSSGPIDWGRPVNIRVSVQVHGVARTVSGSYMGSEERNPYHYVFTCPGQIQTNLEGSNRPLVLIGDVWQTIRDEDDDKRWTEALDAQSDIEFAEGDAPSPAVADFFASHAPDTLPRKFLPDTPDSTHFILTLDGRPGVNAIRYFAAYTDSNTASTGLLGNFDIFSQRLTHVRVAGTAVWLIPHGALFEGELRVELMAGATTGTLVMVVGPNGRHPGHTNDGLWVEKGIQVVPSGGNSPRVFVVSGGIARIRDVITTHDIFARYVSIFADEIRFQGPPYNLPRDNMWLQYQDSMKPLANSLRSLGALPGTTGSPTGQWVLDPGSWTTSPGLQ